MARSTARAATAAEPPGSGGGQRARRKKRRPSLRGAVEAGRRDGNGDPRPPSRQHAQDLDARTVKGEALREAGVPLGALWRDAAGRWRWCVPCRLPATLGCWRSGHRMSETYPDAQAPQEADPASA